jgi:transposase
METMASKKQPRPRRSFTDEFKAEVVELVRQPGNTVGGVARELDLTETAVRAWVKQADIDDGRRNDGLTSAERAEMAQLRKELREAREERDILKRAVAFFAREPGEPLQVRRGGEGRASQRRQGV